MKILRLLVTLAFVLGGIALLCAPSHAQATKPFTPTRFTITDAGTVGKPDIVLIPGLASSKAVWDGEAKLLAPNYRLHIVQIDGFAGAPAGPNATGAFLVPVAEELHTYIAANRIHPVVMGHSSKASIIRYSGISPGMPSIFSRHCVSARSLGFSEPR